MPPLIPQVIPSSDIELATARPKSGTQGAIVTISLLKTINDHNPVHPDAEIPHSGIECVEHHPIPAQDAEI